MILKLSEWIVSEYVSGFISKLPQGLITFCTESLVEPELTDNDEPNTERFW